MEVTPFAGVWIEIRFCIEKRPTAMVTPFAGVWIEMETKRLNSIGYLSHPLRGGVD